MAEASVRVEVNSLMNFRSDNYGSIEVLMGYLRSLSFSKYSCTVLSTFRSGLPFLTCKSGTVDSG